MYHVGGSFITYRLFGSLGALTSEILKVDMTSEMEAPAVEEEEVLTAALLSVSVAPGVGDLGIHRMVWVGAVCGAVLLAASACDVIGKGPCTA